MQCYIIDTDILRATHRGRSSLRKIKCIRVSLIKFKALYYFHTHNPSSNWHLLLNTQLPWQLMFHNISISDRLLTPLLTLKWHIGTMWKFPSSLCLQGNGVENDRLHAIILSENRRTVRESVKTGFNDVRLFFFLMKRRNAPLGLGK